MFISLLLPLAAVTNGVSVDAMPECEPRRDAVHREAPTYPTHVLMPRGVEGFVELVMGITKAGDVSNVRVVASEPLDFFSRSATEAAKKWRFEPSDQECWQSTMFTFELDDEE